ncbi:ImmA/IrrE family metallo-endopeptidase [Nocardioides humilatus]|uniref:ImmA/IrrE family metallo-endopeptidase n=1 Tax=Nocardioides humilatus TaxID=2607660 RepID=A0A5B1LMM8_9ACTN|nr:ImmA/IrrE family metallo-endopeptidase [Nocardioides humilatus]KAA1421932.1 ImmA/IrrE family metallo-endopeptidase [Nocardioides humilatus]
MIHPWRRLRTLTDWELRWHSPEDDADAGFTLFDEKVISLRANLTWEERRCTVLHECLHAERGPTLVGVLAAREELHVRRETARLLLPDIEPVAEALAWSASIDEAATELMVDAGVLCDRLLWIDAAERDHLWQRGRDSNPR